MLSVEVGHNPRQVSDASADCARGEELAAAWASTSLPDQGVAGVPAAGVWSGPHRWQRHYKAALLLADAAMVSVALFSARFGTPDATVSTASYDWLVVLLALAWTASLVGCGTYEARYLGVGAVEYRRVLVASGSLFGCLAVVAYSLKWDLVRGFVAIAFPLGTLLLLAERNLARRWLHRRRAEGKCSFRVLAVGNRGHVEHLVLNVARERYAGFNIVGACLPGAGVGAVAGIPVVGGLGNAKQVAEQLGVDVIAVTASPGVTSDTLRRLAWDLEGSGIDLVVSPSLTDVAGPRISVRPVAGLPLLHVDEPDLGLVHRAVKYGFDRSLAALTLLVMSPLLLAVGVAVRLTSPGPALFRQQRVGKCGKPFSVLKFRTMRYDAESLLADLEQRNESDGLLFKLKQDPRITPLGGWLRKLSIDELPQLINVVKGDMSLVGPRPLPVDPADFVGHERRRLLVKPGITGLWQVSGRSDISWEDAVRLDLYYVENWSLSLDLLILWKTIFAVARSSGAY